MLLAISKPSNEITMPLQKGLSDPAATSGGRSAGVVVCQSGNLQAADAWTYKSPDTHSMDFAT